ncbi:MAG TPA: LacI family DNA-binding transcriptional regulator [Reyranella sp.]|nr:LacI family DNA-binding transcriptional regulator [Reyranella sp.]
MTDVAEAAGVGVMTVSRTFSDAGKVAEETRNRVLKAARTLGFIPNQAAGALSSRTSRVVGLFIPNLLDATYHQIYRGVVDRLEPAGYQVFVAETRYDQSREEAEIRSMLGWRARGMIFTGSERSALSRKLLTDAGAAVCSVMTTKAMDGFTAVGFSSSRSMKALGAHLLERGHCRIALVRSARFTHRRLKARHDALRTAIANKAAFRVLELDADIPFSFRQGADAVDAALATTGKGWTLVFSNDIPAAGAILRARELGLAVPRDLAIVGYAGLEIAEAIRPRLTTVRIPKYDMGAEAARLLIEQMAGREVAQSADLGFELVAGETT